eukprot:jgi/Mesvir1/23398/Mv21092-RA.1
MASCVSTASRCGRSSFESVRTCVSRSTNGRVAVTPVHKFGRLSRSETCAPVFFNGFLRGEATAALAKSRHALCTPADAHVKHQTSRHGARADWNAEVVWTKVPIADTMEAAEGIFKITLDVSKVPGLSYTKPGQYVQFKVGDSKPAFMAIASSPKEAKKTGKLEFLINKLGATASIMTSLPVGGEVEMSPVMGKGFKVEELPANEYPYLLLFAAGTGISAIKAFIEEGVTDRKEVRLYYGSAMPSTMAYKEKFAEWEAAGVQVTPVMSDVSWEGKMGFVQDVYKNDTPIPKPAGALYVGGKAMAEVGPPC